jgi:hypothetical protein
LNKIYDAYLYNFLRSKHTPTFKSKLDAMKVFVSLLAILAPAVVGVMGALVRDIPLSASPPNFSNFAKTEERTA